MDLRDAFRALRRSWVVIAISALFGLAVMSAYTYLSKPVYRATAQAFVSTGAATSVSDLTQGSTFTQQAVKSYAAVATTPYVLNEVRESLGLTDSVSALASKVSASAPLDTVVLNISATDTNPLTAVKIANAVTVRLTSAVQSLTPESSTSASSVKITQVQPAGTDVELVGPFPVLNLALGLVLGVFVGVVLGFLRQRLDTRLHGVHDVRRASPFPVLGAIMFDPDASTRPLVVNEASRSPRAEAFRSLRTNLQFLNFDSKRRSVVVTSSIAGEGKSTSAANLAITLADAGQSVAIIDADLRRPQVANYFGIEGGVGLTDVLIGNVELEAALQRSGDKDLYVLPAGQVPPNPGELIQSDAMAHVIAKLVDKFDTVLFDSPPLLPVSDAAVLAKRTDGAIVVAGVRKATRPQLSASLQVLSQVDARVLGLLVTLVPSKGPDSYGYGSGGYYYYATDDAAPSGRIIA